MLTPIEVARIEEARAAAMLAGSAREVRPWAGGTMGFSEPGSWQNQVMGAGLDVSVSDAELDAMVEFYESRGVEARLELCPFADESLVAGLAARGFTLREFQNVLSCELTSEPPAPPLGWPEGVEVRAVDPADASELDELITVSMSGFVPPSEPIPAPLREAARRLLSSPRMVGFLARIDGRAVGGGSVDIGQGGAALVGTSVFSEARRRGIQQALIVARLAAARERGAQVAVIDSRPGIPTERNAMRLGFDMAYTKVVLARPGEGLHVTP